MKKVKNYLNDERGFSKKEIARLVDISEHSVQRIVQGYYDQPVEKPKAKQSVDSSLSHQDNSGTYTEIPFEKMEHLLKCEMFVEELFSIAVASDKNTDEIYFPRHYANNMCSRYFPDKFQECLERLSYDTNA